VAADTSALVRGRPSFCRIDASQRDSFIAPSPTTSNAVSCRAHLHSCNLKRDLADGNPMTGGRYRLAPTLNANPGKSHCGTAKTRICLVGYFLAHQAGDWRSVFPTLRKTPEASQPTEMPGKVMLK
jgi:hypothetical protein